MRWQFQHRLVAGWNAAQRVLQQSWLLRWTLANMLGWSMGLLVAALLLTHFGIWGAALGGVGAGSLVGILQAMALTTHPHYRPNFRAWVWQSGFGGAIATLPIYILALGLLLNVHATLLLMGAVFGAIQASLQAQLLRRRLYEQALWWVIAGATGGAFCAPLSLSAAAFALPMCFSPGPVLFGLITGITLVKLLAADQDSDETTSEA